MEQLAPALAQSVQQLVEQFVPALEWSTASEAYVVASVALWQRVHPSCRSQA